MAFMEIRVPIAVSLFLIVLGLPASAALLLFGVAGLCHPFHPDFGWGAALVFCGMGVFVLLMAIAAFRGIIHRKRKHGNHPTHTRPNNP
jgi:membrane protein implicated in regulation of membrane protease activity